MEKAVILQDELSGAEVPPDIRVGNPARRHGEHAESENDDTEPAGLQQMGHSVVQSKPIVAPSWLV